MAVTRLSDVIVPQVFASYMLEQSIVKNLLIQSGVVSENAVLSAYLAGGGQTFNLPSWKPIDQNGTAANVPSDDTAVQATPEAVVARKQIAVRLDRNKVFGTADITAALAGSDPLDAVGSYAGLAINQWRQDSLRNVLLGCVNVTNAAGLVNSVAVEATGSYTAATRINASTVIDTFTGWGDSIMAMKGSAIFMHSDTYRYLVKNDFTSFSRGSFQTISLGQNATTGAAPGMDQYLGMWVFVDDTLPKVAGTTSGFKYTSYIVKPGAVTFGMTPAEFPVEVQRFVKDANGGGGEYLALRDTFSYHIGGFKFNSASVAGVVPTDAELATVSNWSQVFNNKAVGVAALIHNAA